MPDIISNRCKSPLLFSSKEPVETINRLIKRERTLSFTKNVNKTEPLLRTAQRTIYTAGRPPWYDTQGQSQECFLIGLLIWKTMF